MLVNFLTTREGKLGNIYCNEVYAGLLLSPVQIHSNVGERMLPLPITPVVSEELGPPWLRQMWLEGPPEMQ